ncbi:Holliday junction branch migration protein RuvA [Caulobacter sp. BK020]|uniref:Holliday junction branch migration protein RuvA n=1 Tax=Caulobacter sp. BK020 TaxID=2512117 RepID=UPI00104CBAE8|nr:Holliday junction branch migration protein RuvA [Caulobacter sp. BK020]TCS12324.1 Holliday junction DNA helicase subunit RuvA [Caulobacter sp. BK020]
MIGRLRGAVAEIGEEEALIDVMGVGYVVRCGARTLQRLPALGEEALLHIESQWSESAGLRLYGFGTREDRKAFVLLQAIQGVGPKAAMAVLDVLSPAELASAVAREDKAAVGRASGVGPKLALRIVTELKDKPITDGPVFLGAPATAAAAATPAKAAPTGDAVAALMGLGVAEVNARRVVEAAAAKLGDEATVQQLIKAGLQELGR